MAIPHLITPILGNVPRTFHYVLYSNLYRALNDDVVIGMAHRPCRARARDEDVRCNVAATAAPNPEIVELRQIM